MFYHFSIDLKAYAANFFYPPTIPWKIEYKDKPKKKKKHHFKQPKANMGYKRGQRRGKIKLSFWQKYYLIKVHM